MILKKVSFIIDSTTETHPCHVFGEILSIMKVTYSDYCITLDFCRRKTGLRCRNDVIGICIKLTADLYIVKSIDAPSTSG